MITSVLRQLLTLLLNGKNIIVNLLIYQNIILYLLLHEIICLDDDENFLIGMHFGCHVFAGAFTFNMYRSDISVKFHFTDLASYRPSWAAGPSKVSEMKFLILFY